eukprot:CAMPEP_0180346716 /NCGR_PEP_ID=MMETSP0989-20121125/4023_1 /TAXON_ID=697907 /ORGANISM="non described non described, Strain CCMP2293" /LENGTH=306 /DNA_ID=CAMNT_0022335869 /DNA_START=119 /DNA_END=1036 /DNA_ORIENTATION=+
MNGEDEAAAPADLRAPPATQHTAIAAQEESPRAAAAPDAGEHAPPVLDAKAEALLAEARKEQVFSYDTKRFPFREMFRRMFQLQDDAVTLDKVHAMELPDRAPLSLAFIHAFKVAGRKTPKNWNKALSRKKDRLKKFIASRAFKDFNDLFAKFVEEVVVPIIGDETGVVSQNPPTFRVQIPSASPIGNLHKDSDYERHVDTEINIWVPVTDVFGANTLHTESEPGKGDFHPLECSYGQLVRFWGNQCRHHTVANSTDATRVSFDFRVVPCYLYTGAFKGFIGDYPTILAPGPLTPPESIAAHLGGP